MREVQIENSRSYQHDSRTAYGMEMSTRNSIVIVSSCQDVKVKNLMNDGQRRSAPSRTRVLREAHGKKSELRLH